MNVNFEKIDNVNAKLTISFVEEDYKSDVKKNLNEIGLKRPIKGFRPGHVPAGMLQKLFGAEVLANVIDRKVGQELSKYIYDNKVPVLGEPMLNEQTKVDLKTQKEFEFIFDLGLAPEFELTLDKTVKVPYYNIEVTDEMVANQDKSFRQRFGKQVAGEVAVEDSLLRGSLTELNEDGTDKEDGIKVEKTVISPQYLKDDDEKNKFVGAKVNDNVVYNPNKAVAGNVTELGALFNIDKEQADVKSDFRFQVSEILVSQDAELGQELYDNALGKDQAKTEEEYLAKVKEMLEAQLKNDSNYRFSIDAEAALRKQVGELELPEEFLKRFLKAQNPDEADKVDENFAHTKEQLQWQLIKEKVVKQFALKVEVEDKMRLARYFAAQQFAQYGMSNLPDDVIDNYAHKLLEDERYSQEITNRAMDDKIYAQIQNAVSLTKKKVSVEKFNKLFENK
ncbi:MAG: trigger factor [Bacteroidales bacterium]|nr:trigger factor [Candidatus Sodaliphilus aphodohippi]